MHLDYLTQNPTRNKVQMRRIIIFRLIFEHSNGVNLGLSIFVSFVVESIKNFNQVEDTGIMHIIMRVNVVFACTFCVVVGDRFDRSTTLVIKKFQFKKSKVVCINIGYDIFKTKNESFRNIKFDRVFRTLFDHFF